MSKRLLMISTVLLLVLGIAGVVMSYLLFEQRETIKGRNLKLENAIFSIAKTVESGEDDGSMIQVDREELKILTPQKDGPQVTMDKPLNRLMAGAQSQLDRLNATRVVLSDTEEKLTNTEEELKVTQDSLQVSNNKNIELSATIVDRNREIVSKENMIRDLEGEKTQLNAKVTEQALTIADLDVEKKSLEDDKEKLELEVKKLVAILSKDGGKTDLGEGQLGEIVSVDRDWNFCLFKVPEDKVREMLPNIELLIHRGNEFVSKVRITKVVEPSFVVAEIMNDWQKADMKQGDSVITGSWR